MSRMTQALDEVRVPRRPNVLFIMSDQHRADVLGVEGRRDVATPHLDGLARAGAHCRRAYCNNAICGASRNSLQLGMYGRTLGITTFEGIGYDGPMTPMQASFRAAGYATGAFGKRHLQPAADVGWDVTATTVPAENESADESWWDYVRQRGLAAEADADWAAEFGGEGAKPMAVAISELPDDATMEAWTARRTKDFMREQHAADRPFFAFCSFYRPHQPYTPTQRWWDTIDPAKLELPPTLYESAEKLPPLLEARRKRTANAWCLAEAAKDVGLYRKYVHAYLALVAEIDHHVGGLLGELDAMGIAEDTIVVYTADHGDFVAGHGMIEKCSLGHNVYEETVRVPLMVRWPGKVQAGVRDDLIELVDVLPTLLGLSGIAPGDDTQLRHGLDLSDCLLRGAAVTREVAITENGSQVTAIAKDAKLGRWIEPMHPERDFRAFGDQLFLRETDPYETRNAYDDPAAAEPRKRLNAALDAFLARMPAEAWHRAAAEYRG